MREDSDRVYGIVWRLEKDDERSLAALGETEGYSQENATVEFWARGQGEDGRPIPVNIQHGRIQRVRVVMHADRVNTKDGQTSGPYHYKINMGIQDALAEGIPHSYVDEYIKPLLPKVEGEQALSLAIEEAVRKGVDVKKLLESAELKLAKGSGINGVNGVNGMTGLETSMARYVRVDDYSSTPMLTILQLVIFY